MLKGEMDGIQNVLCHAFGAQMPESTCKHNNNTHGEGIAPAILLLLDRQGRLLQAQHTRSVLKVLK